MLKLLDYKFFIKTKAQAIKSIIGTVIEITRRGI